MNCELMLTYDTPALRQTGSRNPMGPKTLPTIWGTYMKLVTKYQISVINSYWEKCDEKCAYMFNVYKYQLSRQTGSRNLTGPPSTVTEKNVTKNILDGQRLNSIPPSPFGERGYNKKYTVWSLSDLLSILVFLRYHTCDILKMTERDI